MKNVVTVTSATRYSVVDESTGVVNNGVSVRFFCTDTMEPCATDSMKGYKLSKASVPAQDYDKFKAVPGIYECDFDISVAGDGTMKVKANNFEFVKPLAVANTK